MLFAPQVSSAGVFCSSAATSPPGALASLVLTFNQPVVSKPALERPSPGSVAIALLTTCQSGVRSIVDAEAAPVRPAKNATAVMATLRTPSNGLPPRLRPSFLFVAFPNENDAIGSAPLGQARRNR